MLASAQFNQNSGNCLAHIIQRVLAVLPKVVSFTTVANGLIGFDGVKENDVEISN
jgi:hypothetical protein